MEHLEEEVMDRLREALFCPLCRDRSFHYAPAGEQDSKPLARTILPGNMVSHHGSTEA